MPVLTHLLLLAGFLTFGALSTSITQLPFPNLPVPFSPSFTYPQPPLLQTEFTANYMQQKYDATGINNIVAGFIYYSPSSRKVRADGAFNGVLESSQFDFTNVSSTDGSVKNTLFQLQNGTKQSQGSCETTFAPTAFQLFASDILNSTQAAWIGLEHDALYGPLSAWQFPFPPNVVVTMFLDANNTLVRYDFSVGGQSLKTFATTRFFNIVAGPVPASVFDTDCT